MRVLIVGSGGREHAIVWKLSKSPKIKKMYCAPGNAGIAELAECVEIQGEDIERICQFAVANKIDLAVIGPEVPLSLGIVDALEDKGIRTFGPNKKCAQLEASKAFTKKFLERHRIPTARYKEFTDRRKIEEDIGIFGYPMVIKADGLAAGKGVIIAETKEEAEKAIGEIMGDKVFGTAGDKIVVEEFLTGVEASMLCFVDENTIVPMESVQDYKRIFDGDKGPNTGGMGTYSPSLIFDGELQEKINNQILLPTLKGFQEDGLNFKGVLFVGLMIKDGEPKVIEFNNRFGDPETQVILVRLETDLLDIFEAVINNRLSEIKLKWSEKKAVCVVMAAGGYPGNYEKGDKIYGLEKVDKEVTVFHAGTVMKTSKQAGPSNDCYIATNGGRVLGTTAFGETHEEGRIKAYDNVKRITFNGAQYRKDIGLM
ncbi:MAG: phosphoribosylamine--glycine ligase [Peptostreptococcaceae bacterium]|nr:phosphoribosylamine--glycine ligase [Peptostreptococcaceae bacterium]